jgi:hypothetical protein
MKYHKTLRCTPAMVAGPSATLRGMKDIVKLIDDAAEPAQKRGPYMTKAKRAALVARGAENSNCPTTEG